MKRDLATLVKAVLCVLVIDACGGTLGGNPEKTEDPVGQGQPGIPDPATAALTFSITDAPVEDARNVFVSVESVQIAKSDDSWVTIPMASDEEIDLLALQDGKSSVLAAIADLPAGTYGQTRLILAEEAPGRLIDKDGVEHELVVPSGNESGLKIQTAFTKVDGERLALTIDFDLRKSIKWSGNGNTDNPGKGNKTSYILKPTLRMTNDSKSGGASGEGEDGSVVCVYANDAVKDATDSCDNAITSASVKNGKFKISFLETGTYDLRVFRNAVLVGDVNDVDVKAGEDNDEIELP